MPDVPDTDPGHVDPAGDLVDAVESGDLELTIEDDDQGVEELREFLRRTETGKFDTDPGLEATVRIVRSILNDLNNEKK